MANKITLSQADFDALPEWPQSKLPPRIAGNKWRYKLGPKWCVAGYEDVAGFVEIVLYEGFVIENSEAAK